MEMNMDMKALIEIAEYLKSESVANELQKLDQRQQDSNVSLTLPIVGEFSSGKTSLINALTDSKQLEIATKPTTATIYLLHFGQDRQYATIHRADGCEETVEAIGSLKNSELADVPLVDIYDTSTRVSRDLVLVDTPGLSSPDARHKDALIGFLPKADAILMAVDCNQQITHSLLRFVEETKLAGRKVYLIVTKCDTKPASDREQIKKYIAENSKLPMEHIACVSAQQDDLTEFYDLIAKLSQNKKEILGTAIRGRLEILKEELKKSVSELLKQPSSTEGLEKELSGHERHVEELEREVKHLISSVRYAVEDVSDEISRHYQNLLFQRLDALINQRADNLNTEANTIIKSTSLQVMAEYRRRIAQELTEQSVKASPFIQSAVTRLDISGLEAPELSMNIDLDSMGHKYDKAIAKGLQAVAIAAIAIPVGIAAMGAATAATGTVAGTAGAVGSEAAAAASSARLATVASVADTVTDVGSIRSTRKLRKSLRMAQLVQQGKEVAANYEAIDSKVAPKMKGFVEGIVSTFTDRMAKPRRLRIMHDFIEQQLAPVFAEQMQQNGSDILSDLQAAIGDSCKEIVAERTAQITDLMNAIKAQKGEYQQKIAKLKAYYTTLNS